jgi:hypothetical protein
VTRRAYPSAASSSEAPHTRAARVVEERREETEGREGKDIVGSVVAGTPLPR